MSGTNLPLPIFYAQTLTSLLPLFDDSLSPSSASYQSTIQTQLDNLHLIARMITSLGVFSDNETVDELGDGELRFMTLGWVVGECEGKGGLGGLEDRKGALRRSETAFNSFLSLLSSYKVLSPEEEAESSAMANRAAPRDPTRRREAKIRQYKREKELRERITPSPSSSPLTFILSLLPQSRSTPISTSQPAASSSSSSVNPDIPWMRDLALLILRLLHTLALSSLSSISQELELLASAPSEASPSPDPRLDGGLSGKDNTWRLDRKPGPSVKPRELISGGGRVLRPFTILPSTAAMSDRERLRGEVFRESWRLPTMTIDEYLDEERRRGNIISGGGQASYDAPTESELLALAAEEDGTMAGNEAAERRRQKEEQWAEYTEANPRGAGNTLNRG